MHVRISPGLEKSTQVSTHHHITPAGESHLSLHIVCIWNCYSPCCTYRLYVAKNKTSLGHKALARKVGLYPGTKVLQSSHTPPQLLLLDVMTRLLAAVLAYDLFPSFTFVRLHGDRLLSQTHLTQALCELRGAYPGRGVDTSIRQRWSLDSS